MRRFRARECPSRWAYPFLCLKRLLLVLSLASAQQPPGLLDNEGVWARNLELQRIQCDDDPVPFKISLSYYAFRSGTHEASGPFLWEPADVTAQKLCSKPAYGGWESLERQGLMPTINITPSLGGFCPQWTNEQNQSSMLDLNYAGIFDEAPPDQAIPPRPGVVFQLPSDPDDPRVEHHPWNDRVRLFCRTYCWCNRQWDPESNTTVEVTERPKGFPPDDDVYETRGQRMTREIDMDYRAIQHIAANDHLRYGELITGLLDVNLEGFVIQHFKREIHLAQKNHIECSVSPLPEMALPDPYNIEDFPAPGSIQKMCAVALSGGNV